MNKKQKKLILTILVILSCFLFTACTAKVKFSSGEKHPVDLTNLSLVIEADEVQLLDQFTALETLDLSGSRCYDEIYAWAKAHPEVDVRYTLELPGETLVEHSCRTLDLSSLDESLYDEAFEFFKYMDELETVKLSHKALTTKQLADYSARFPEIFFDCEFSFFSQTFSSADQSMDLTGLEPDDIDALIDVLPAMHRLKTVMLGSQESSPELSWGDIADIQAARTDVSFVYEFSYLGLDFSTTDTSMDLRGRRIYDNGEEVTQILRCMPELRYLDMDSCKVKSEDMAAIRDEFPDVEVVWRVWFGDVYSVRTDVERILASKPSVGGDLTASNTQELKYCTKVKYLDVGHNGMLTDISFISYMPELEVAILAISGWSDGSPLADCPKLEYLEIQTTYISDLSPLANLTELKHLNIAYVFDITDISPLYGLTKLERLWLGCVADVPEEQVQTFQKLVPDCVINRKVYNDPTSGNWRFTGGPDETGTLPRSPRYALLLEQFGYTDRDYAFFWNDPLYIY